jgi:hypothetical protein
MATTQVRTPETDTPPPPARGRNRSRNGKLIAPPPIDQDLADELTAAAERLEGEAGGTPVDEDRRWKGGSEQDFFEWLSQWTADDWQYMLAYLYRTAPTIDRRASGRPTSLKKYGSYFDLDQIMHEEGSGGYRIDLTRRDKQSGRYTRIAQVYFGIMNMDYPPRVPAGDWINEPENEVYKWAKPKLEEAQAMGYGNQHTDPNKVFDTVLSGIERLRGAQPQGEGNSATAATITGLSNLVTALVNRPAPAADESMKTMVTFLMSKLEEGNKEMRELRMLLIQNSKQPGLLEQLTQIMPAVTQFKDLLGLKGGGRAAQTGLADVAVQVVDKLGDAVPMLYEMWRTSQGAQANGGTGTANGFRLPAAQPKKDQPAAAAADPTAAGAPATEQAKPEEPTMPPEKEAHYKAILAKWGALIQSVAPFLVDHFRANLTGYEFRDWFISRQGVNNYAAFRSAETGGVTVDDLVELAQLHSYLATMLQPREKLVIFLTEFLTEPEPETEDDAKGKD